MIVKCDECIIEFSIPVTDGPVPCPNCRRTMKQGAELAHSDKKIQPGKFITSLVLRPIN